MLIIRISEVLVKILLFILQQNSFINLYQFSDKKVEIKCLNFLVILRIFIYIFRYLYQSYIVTMSETVDIEADCDILLNNLPHGVEAKYPCDNISKYAI